MPKEPVPGAAADPAPVGKTEPEKAEPEKSAPEKTAPEKTGPEKTDEASVAPTVPASKPDPAPKAPPKAPIPQPAPAPRRGSFFPTVLGGIVAAGLGAGAMWYAVPRPQARGPGRSGPADRPASGRSGRESRADRGAGGGTRQSAVRCRDHGLCHVRSWRSVGPAGSGAGRGHAAAQRRRRRTWMHACRRWKSARWTGAPHRPPRWTRLNVKWPTCAPCWNKAAAKAKVRRA